MVVTFWEVTITFFGVPYIFIMVHHFFHSLLAIETQWTCKKVEIFHVKSSYSCTNRNPYLFLGNFHEINVINHLSFSRSPSSSVIIYAQRWRGRNEAYFIKPYFKFLILLNVWIYDKIVVGGNAYGDSLEFKYMTSFDCKDWWVIKGSQINDFLPFRVTMISP